MGNVNMNMIALTEQIKFVVVTAIFAAVILCFQIEGYAEPTDVMIESKDQAGEAARSFYRYTSVPKTSKNEDMLENAAIEEGIKAGESTARKRGHVLTDIEIGEIKTSAEKSLRDLKQNPAVSR